MGLAGAFGQIAVMATILLAGSLYTKHHVTHMQRADHSGAVYMEDSRPGNGTRYKVLVRAADTQHASYSIEVMVRGTAEGFVHGLAGSLPGHTHTEQEEVLQVTQGSLGVIQGQDMNQQSILTAGERLVIPKGTPHTLYNADNSTAVVYELQHSPAGPMGESFFENLAGLGWDYTALDRMHPLQVLVLYDAAEIVLYDIPSILQPVVKKVLIPVAKLLGFKSHYASHTSAAGQGQPPAAAPEELAQVVGEEEPAETQAAEQEIQEAVQLQGDEQEAAAKMEQVLDTKEEL